MSRYSVRELPKSIPASKGYRYGIWDDTLNDWHCVGWSKDAATQIVSHLNSGVQYAVIQMVSGKWRVWQPSIKNTFDRWQPDTFDTEDEAMARCNQLNEVQE